MRQTTLKHFYTTEELRLILVLFSTPTMQRVLRSKSQSEGRARSTALSYTRFVHCTLTPKTTGEAPHSTGHTGHPQACASRGAALGKHRRNSKGWKKQAGENPGISGCQSPSSALVPATHTVMASPEAAGRSRSGCRAVPVSPVPCRCSSSQQDTVGCGRAAPLLREVTAKSRSYEVCPVPPLPQVGATC